MTTPDLFSSVGVEVPTSHRAPVNQLRRARSLSSQVSSLIFYNGLDFPARARAVARVAELIEAHSVARAVRWYARPGTIGRYGWDASTIRLERVVRRWLERIERAELKGAAQ